MAGFDPRDIAESIRNHPPPNWERLPDAGDPGSIPRFRWVGVQKSQPSSSPLPPTNTPAAAPTPAAEPTTPGAAAPPPVTDVPDKADAPSMRPFAATAGEMPTAVTAPASLRGDIGIRTPPSLQALFQGVRKVY